MSNSTVPPRTTWSGLRRPRRTWRAAPAPMGSAVARGRPLQPYWYRNERATPSTSCPWIVDASAWNRRCRSWHAVGERIDGRLDRGVGHRSPAGDGERAFVHDRGHDTAGRHGPARQLGDAGEPRRASRTGTGRRGVPTTTRPCPSHRAGPMTRRASRSSSKVMLIRPTTPYDVGLSCQPVRRPSSPRTRKPLYNHAIGAVSMPFHPQTCSAPLRHVPCATWAGR